MGGYISSPHLQRMELTQRTEREPHSTTKDPLTLKEALRIIPLITYQGISQDIKRDVILAALAQMEPTMVTITWLSRVISTKNKNRWYITPTESSWTRTLGMGRLLLAGNRSNTGKSTGVACKIHFMALHSRYMEQYALAGGDLTMTVRECNSEGAVKTLMDIVPSTLQITTINKTLEWWISNYPEYGVLNDIMDVNKIEDDHIRIKAETALCKYLAVRRIDGTAVNVDRVLSSLKQARKKLGKSKEWDIIIESCQSYADDVISEMLTNAFMPSNVGQILQILRPEDPRGGMILQHGSLARIAYADMSVGMYILGLPMNCRPDISTYYVLINEMLADLDVYHYKIKSNNRRRINNLIDELPWVTVPEYNEDILSYQPYDLILSVAMGTLEVRVRTSYNEWDSSDNAESYQEYESKCRESYAEWWNFPEPAPFLVQVARLTDATYYQEGSTDEEECGEESEGSL